MASVARQLSTLSNCWQTECLPKILNGTEHESGSFDISLDQQLVQFRPLDLIVGLVIQRILGDLTDPFAPFPQNGIERTA
jgi:hypothetical protein